MSLAARAGVVILSSMGFGRTLASEVMSIRAEIEVFLSSLDFGAPTGVGVAGGTDRSTWHDYLLLS